MRRSGVVGRAHSGFTLLEMAVVAAILGIIAGMALVAARAVSTTDGTARESARLQGLLLSAGQRAVLTGRPIGLVTTAGRYDFVEESGGRWQPLEGDPILHRRVLPQGISIAADPPHRRSDRPAAVFAPDGTAEAATLRLSAEQGPGSTVRVSAVGDVVLGTEQAAW